MQPQQITKPTYKAHSPELVDNWVLVTVVEAIILILLTPALFHLGAIWGVLALIFTIFLLGSSFLWRQGQAVSYQFFEVLHIISLVALLGAILTFVTIASVTVSLLSLLGLYLAGYLDWKMQRGYSFILKAIVTVMVILALIVAPEEARNRIYLLLGFLALYFLSGGAVRFYFGHTFAELDREDVLAYFGYSRPPAIRRGVNQLLSLPTRWLRSSYHALDTLFGPLSQLSPGLSRKPPRTMPTGNGERTLQVILIVVAILVFPYLVRQLESATSLSILISLNAGLILVVLALGLNIVVGFAGLLDLGYAAFFAIGAYTVGVFTWPTLGLEWSFWVVILVSTLVAAIFGLIIGAPTLRLRGDYLAIVTLAFGEIVPRAIREMSDIKLKIPFTDIYLISAEGFFYNSQGQVVEGFNLTNGPQGMNPVGRPTIFGFEIGSSPLDLGFMEIPPPVQWYLLIVVMGAIVLFACLRLQNSRLGRAWMAIREDETAADAMGVDPVRTKLLAFALGASFSGFAGSLYAAMIQAIFPELFSFLVSIFLLIIVIVSGMGNIWGVLLGGVLITLFDRVLLAQIVPEYLPGGDILQSWRWVMYAAGLIAVMILRPEGLFPSAARKAELRTAQEELSDAEIAAILERERREAEAGV